MSARLIDGRAIADTILAEVEAGVKRRLSAGGSRPFLAAVLDPEDAASVSYVRLKRRACERVGIGYRDHHVHAGATTDSVLDLVSRLNADPEVTGILLQLPQPAGVDSRLVLEAISPGKDVDGFHPVNAGRLLLGETGVRPCTPAGVVHILDACGIPTEGSRAVIIGRSNIVGKPLALMMLERNATVTVCHTRTRDLGGICREADILVAAVGRPGTVSASMVRPGAAVIDVGINRLGGRLVGDCDPGVAEVAGWLTPVPGGVGPLTVAMLMRNTLAAEEAARP